MRYLPNKWDESEHMTRAELERYLMTLHRQINHALDAYRTGDDVIKQRCVPVLNRLGRSLVETKTQLAQWEQEAG